MKCQHTLAFKTRNFKLNYLNLYNLTFVKENVMLSLLF